MRKISMLKQIFVLFILIFSLKAFAQELVTLSGFVTDSETGEVLIGANIYVPDKQIGGSTNDYGFYSISLPKGEYTFRFAYMGYKSSDKILNLSKDLKLRLTPFFSRDLKEILALRLIPAVSTMVIAWPL